MRINAIHRAVIATPRLAVVAGEDEPVSHVAIIERQPWLVSSPLVRQVN